MKNGKNLQLPISSGQWKGLKFEFPLRLFPQTGIMMSKIKEALFSIVTSSHDPKQTWFADLFAGTGLVAFEAASRGFLPVLANEIDRSKVSLIQRNSRIIESKFGMSLADAVRSQNLSESKADKMAKNKFVASDSFLIANQNAFYLLSDKERLKKKLGLVDVTRLGVVFCDPPFIGAKDGHNRDFWHRFVKSLQNLLLQLDPGCMVVVHAPLALGFLPILRQGCPSIHFIGQGEIHQPKADVAAEMFLKLRSYRYGNHELIFLEALA